VSAEDSFSGVSSNMRGKASCENAFSSRWLVAGSAFSGVNLIYDRSHAAENAFSGLRLVAEIAISGVKFFSAEGALRKTRFPAEVYPSFLRTRLCKSTHDLQYV